MHTRLFLRAIAPALLALSALAFLACEDSDPVAPDGSTITLNANPSPIVGVPGISTISARVFNSNGIPVPEDTQVLFDSSSGRLSAENARTDDDGVARTDLTVNSSTTVTVTARSGGVSASIQIQVVTADVANVILRSLDPQVELVCSDRVDLEGEVLDSSGNGIPSVLVTFNVVSSNPAGLNGVGQQTVTDGAGRFFSTWVFSPEQSCLDNCTGGKVCTVNIEAVAATVRSGTLQIDESVP